jgi:hypothetical protein
MAVVDPVPEKIQTSFSSALQTLLIIYLASSLALIVCFPVPDYKL